MEESQLRQIGVLDEKTVEGKDGKLTRQVSTTSVEISVGLGGD